VEKFNDTAATAKQFGGQYFGYKRRLGKLRLHSDEAWNQQMQHRVNAHRHYIGRLNQQSCHLSEEFRPVTGPSL